MASLHDRAPAPARRSAAGSAFAEIERELRDAAEGAAKALRKAGYSDDAFRLVRYLAYLHGIARSKVDRDAGRLLTPEQIASARDGLLKVPGWESSMELWRLRGYADELAGRHEPPPLGAEAAPRAEERK